MRISLLILFYLIALSNKAQLVRGEFAIGGVNNDYGQCIIQTKDHGYIIAGNTSSFGAGGSDMYAIKLDSNAQIQWTKTIGGIRDEYAYSVIQTNDMGYLLAGSTRTYGDTTSDASVYLVKLDINGNLVWTKTYGNGAAFNVLQTLDGRYIITGTNRIGGVYNMYIIRTDQLGNISWSKTLYAGTGHTIIQTHDGGFAVSGYIGYENLYIAKLDSGGTVNWAESIGGGNEQGASLIETSDKGLVMAGFGRSYGVCCNNDVYVVKVDSSGTLKWTKTIGGVGNDYAYSVIENRNKEIVIAGQDGSFGIGGDIYIMKLDLAGTVKYTKTVGGTGFDMANSIIQTNDHGYALTGFTNSYGAGGYDIYIVKLDSNFLPHCADTSSGATIKQGGLATPGFTLVAGTPTSYTTGATLNNGGFYTDMCSITTGISSLATRNTILITPNPTTGCIKVNKVETSSDDEISIYNSYGSLIFSGKLQEKETSIDLNSQSNGIYFIKIRNVNRTETKKIIKE